MRRNQHFVVIEFNLFLNSVRRCTMPHSTPSDTVNEKVKFYYDKMLKVLYKAHFSNILLSNSLCFNFYKIILVYFCLEKKSFFFSAHPRLCRVRLN